MFGFKKSETFGRGGTLLLNFMSPPPSSPHPTHKKLIDKIEPDANTFDKRSAKNCELQYCALLSLDVSIVPFTFHLPL
jgi:hypothetical protein